MEELLPESIHCPEGIHCQYIYSPTIQQTQLVIEVNSSNLPPSWKSLILKLAEAHEGKTFSLTNYEERLFNQLLTDTPPPQPGISIKARPLLDQRNVVIKFIHKNENLRWNLPPKSNNFVGRNELLEKMQCHFNKDITNKPLLLTACHGLGGVGKTQLALEFCWRNDQKYKNICWFSAETQERLINDYINLGENELHILFSGDREDKRTPKDKAVYIRNWLQKSDKKPNEWLLIYDNAPNHQEIADLLPHRGNILITSRHIVWPGKTIAVDVFILDEAREYVKKITIIQNEPENIDQLIKLLGALPLALAQACAYIKRNRKSIEAYLDLYKKNYINLLASQLLPFGEKHDPVAVTFDITLTKMKEEAPISVKLLYFCSQLHCENILDALINDFFSEDRNDAYEISVDEAKRVAEEYSMITWNSKTGNIFLHNLIHEILKIQLYRDGNQWFYLEKSVFALMKTYNYDSYNIKDIQLKVKLKPHLNEILKNIKLFNPKKKIVLDLLENISIYISNLYGILGMIKERKEILKSIMKTQAKYSYTSSIKRAVIFHNLGCSYHILSSLEKSKTLLEKSLNVFQNRLGHNHIQVAITLSSLGDVCIDSGNLETAKNYLYKSLTIQLCDYAKINPRIAYTFISLSRLSLDIQEKKEFIKFALDIQKYFYGADSPEVAVTLKKIAQIYKEYGESEKSEKYIILSGKIQKSFFNMIFNTTNDLSGFEGKSNNFYRYYGSLSHNCYSFACALAYDLMEDMQDIPYLYQLVIKKKTILSLFDKLFKLVSHEKREIKQNFFTNRFSIWNTNMGNHNTFRNRAVPMITNDKNSETHDNTNIEFQTSPCCRIL